MSRKRQRTKRPASPTRPRVTPPSSGSGLSPEAAQALRSALPATGRPAPRAAAPTAPTAPTAPAGAVPVAAPAEPAAAPGRQVEVSAWSCSAVEDVEPQALGMTHWVDAAADGEPATLRVRFSGRRVGVGEPATFSRDVAVGPVPAGVGRVAVTSRATVPAGEWEVRAVALDERGEVDRRAPAAGGRGRTTFAPVARALAPGVRPYAWPGLVLLGTVAALVAQVLLGGVRDVASGRLLAVSALACVLGTLGAKAYYLLTHRGQTQSPLAAGMSIQGFVLVAISTIVLGSLAVGVAVGDALDVTTPGLLAGMAIGRLGCWFGGCCAGRPTASRWGLWSSDRVMGVRRIPVQFMESAMTAVLAAATAVLVGTGLLDRGGTTFVIGIAAYTLGRQVLFPLRDIPRSTRFGRPLMTLVTAVAIALAAAADVAG